MKETRPLRAVTHAKISTGRGSLLGDQGRRRRWWVLTLDCGHKETRDMRYDPGKPRGRGWQLRPMSERMPPPNRVRCTECREQAADDRDVRRRMAEP